MRRIFVLWERFLLIRLLGLAELLDLVNRRGAPDVPVATRPLDQVTAALNDLRDGKIVGRVVMRP
jgi:D-arabinose 1-dehydrogenase-like Zn-dependent alcohol dehydrogenase